MEQRIEIVGVNDDGRVAFVTLDTTGYSLVLDMKLYVADLKNKYIVSSSVSQARLMGEELIFIEEDKLYICNINDRLLNKSDGNIAMSERNMVDEEVLTIVDNILGEELLYITDAGLWVYENSGSSLLASGVDASAQIYYSPEEQFLYYRNMNKLYSVDKSGRSTLVIESVTGDVIVSESRGFIMVVDAQAALWKLDKNRSVVDTGVTGCGRVIGDEACIYIKDNRLIYNNFDKTVTINTNNVQSAEVVFASGKYLYFVDSSNVLWKIDKKGKSQESMGYVQLVVRIE